jgi:hypothetical protein
VGDDANHVLILDQHYQKVKEVRLFDFPTKRIPKAEKTDFETSVVLKQGDVDYLVVLGSASKKKRAKITMIPLLLESSFVAGQLFETHTYKAFIKRLKAVGIEEPNIEGSAVIGKQFILSNRGNKGNFKNYVIITEENFWLRQDDVPISIIELTTTSSGVLGISEMCYVESRDLLLFTLSSEVTSNSYDDGAIGDSHLGWIENVSGKINQPDLTLNGLLNLSDHHSDFKGHKIEGICIEKVTDNALTLHLVSDNDLGESHLFKIELRL